MSHERLILYYTTVLSVAGLGVTDDGCVYVIPPKAGIDPLPFVVVVKGEKLRMVLPTKEHLKNPSPANLVFHPLIENLMRSESEVIKAFRIALMQRINYQVLELIHDILVLASSPALHKHLSPEQSEILSKLKNANENTLEVLLNVQKIPGNQIYRTFAKLFVKPSGKKGGKTFTKLGVVSFPLYEQLLDDDAKIGGQPIAKKHRELFKHVYEFILPKITEQNHYGFGSNSMVSPSFEAVLQSAGAVYYALAGIHALFADSNLEELFLNRYDVNYDTHAKCFGVSIDELKKDAKLIPMQPGNEGTPLEEEEQSAEQAQAKQAQALPPSHSALPSAYQQAPRSPTQAETGRPLTFAEQLKAGEERRKAEYANGLVYQRTRTGVEKYQRTSVNPMDPYANVQEVLVPVDGRNYGQNQLNRDQFVQIQGGRNLGF